VKVSELMTRDVEIVSPSDTIQQAAKIMARIDTGFLPVADNDRLVGVITDRDIAIRAVAEGKDPARTPVKEIVTPEVRFVYEDEDVSDVADKMAEWQVRRLPVVDRNNHLAGVISLADIAREHAPQDAGEALQGISRPGGQHSQSSPRA
jgi:CBS domain-containing protein